jgi:hypothetical protein
MSRGTKKESLPSRWLNEGSTNFAVLNQKDPNPRTNLMRRENITDIKKYRRTQRNKPLLQLGPLPEAELYKRKAIELIDHDMPKRKSYVKKRRSVSKLDAVGPNKSASPRSASKSKDEDLEETEEEDDEIPVVNKKSKITLPEVKQIKPINTSGFRSLFRRSHSKHVKLPAGMHGGKRRKSTRKTKWWKFW